MPHESKSAPADRLQAPGTTRFTTTSEETAGPQFTSGQREVLSAAYELLREVARRAQEDGRAAA